VKPLFCDGLTWFCVPLDYFLRGSEVVLVLSGIILVGMLVTWSVHALKRRLMPCLLLVAVSALVGCTHLPIPGPLYPLTVAAGGAVLLEDLFEDPACDAQETSVIERIADLLNAPMTVLWQLIAFEASVGWTVADAVAGNPLRPEVRFEQILAWLPVRSAGVPPSLTPRPVEPCPAQSRPSRPA